MQVVKLLSQVGLLMAGAGAWKPVIAADLACDADLLHQNLRLACVSWPVGNGPLLDGVPG
jgi:hypothetical protein